MRINKSYTSEPEREVIINLMAAQGYALIEDAKTFTARYLVFDKPDPDPWARLAALEARVTILEARRA